MSYQNMERDMGRSRALEGKQYKHEAHVGSGRQHRHLKDRCDVIAATEEKHYIRKKHSTDGRGGKSQEARGGSRRFCRRKLSND